MNKVIATRADEKLDDIAALTHPVFKTYAEEWGADFMRISGETDCPEGDGRWHFRIMQCYDILKDYERILLVDTDIIINKNCPNPFEIVPEDCIGTIYEDKGSRRPHRLKSIQQAQRQFGDIGWEEGYINTGFFVVSKMHQEIFTKIDGQYYTDFGSDDVHLGYQINKMGFRVHELPFTFNHMCMFSEPWNGNPDRFDSHVIHYAGTAAFPGHSATNSPGDKLRLMRSDWERIWGNYLPMTGEQK